MKLRILLLANASLLALASFAAPGALAQQQVDTARRVSFRAPDEVASYKYLGNRDAAGGGSQLRYQKPGTDDDWIDVYVYPPHVEGDCRRACDSIAANTEADDFAGLIPEMVSRGYYDSLRVASDERVDLPSGGQVLHGRHLALRGGREGRPVSSQFYLVPAGNMLVKVRATYAPSATRDSVVDAFTRGFVSTALQRAQACEARPRLGNAMGMDVELNLPVAQVRAQALAAFQKLGYQLEPGSADATEWRTLPKQGWPPGDWGEMASFPHPGVVVWARVEATGSGTRLHVGAQPVCGVPQKPDLEGAVALIAAMQVINEFTGGKKQ